MHSQQLPKLHSQQSSVRLEQIAELRARGIGEHIDLPQLVVCGDQSAGKSSVLEGLTGIPFPRQDGVCTKFATEIILRQTISEHAIVATIIPDSDRCESSKAQLTKYYQRLSSFAELPAIIEDVGFLMGIRGFKDSTTGPGFGQDVLRIEVTGPTGLHLTVVDLPGMISVTSEDQTEADVEIVQHLVDLYVSNPRTIILAVVQANNDIANQGIIQKSRRFDKKGQRTVGIITKPDLINVGTEKRIASLAKNQDTTKLKLGFFLIKNPSPTELEGGLSAEQRQQNEKRFFQSSPWKDQGLDPARVGIQPLRAYLQNLLDQHIERELPKVREDLRKVIATVEQDIAAMGDDRPTVADLRIYLSRLAVKFHNLTTCALNGTYHEADTIFFGTTDDDTGYQKRLRAVVHQKNTSFAEHLRDNGQKRKIRNDGPDDDSVPAADEEEPEEGQVLVTEQEMKEWVKQVYVESRGKELPGNYNHVLLSTLFHTQSSRWPELAKSHVDDVNSTIVKFVQQALRYVIKDDRVYNNILDEESLSLRKHLDAAKNELGRLFEDERFQPITYNHYYTDNIQNARQDTMRKLIKKAMSEATSFDWNGKLHVSNNHFDAAKLLLSLQNRVVIDMDAQACTEALAGLEAYYKVAQKTFVDNVCRQVVERHLIQGLSWIFCPEAVAGYSDAELQRLAAEMPEDMAKRKQLRELHDNLTDSLRALRR